MMGNRCFNPFKCQMATTFNKFYTGVSLLDHRLRLSGEGLVWQFLWKTYFTEPADMTFDFAKYLFGGRC